VALEDSVDVAVLVALEVADVEAEEDPVLVAVLVADDVIVEVKEVSWHMLKPPLSRSSRTSFKTAANATHLSLSANLMLLKLQTLEYVMPGHFVFSAAMFLSAVPILLQFARFEPPK